MNKMMTMTMIVMRTVRLTMMMTMMMTMYIWSIEEKAVGGASLMSDSASSQSNAPCGWEPG